MESSSSSESLNEDGRSDNQQQNNSAPSPVSGSSKDDQQRSVSPAGTVKSQTNYSFPRPPLPIRRVPFLSSGSAFISYVRRRGEPDGGQTDAAGPLAGNAQPIGGSQIMHDSSLANTTDSELSDGYTTQQIINKAVHLSKGLGYSSLRGTIKVSRPGGGSESDAAFTPSPITIQNVDTNLALSLAHQTRIRNLYTNTGIQGYLVENTREGHNHPIPNSRRPDSSSSASSATDWEGSGHATVLRRANQSHTLPPLPPPRQTLPMVDSLRPLAPLAPVYNNLGNNSGNNMSLTGNVLESTSSDSEFERGGFNSNLNNMPNSSHSNMNSIRGKSKIKLSTHHQQQQNLQHQQQHQQQQITQQPQQQQQSQQQTQQQFGRKISDQFRFMDRLSVRTEISASSTGVNGSVANTMNVRKQLSTLPDDDSTLNIGASNLYFSQSDSNDQLAETSKDLITKNTSATLTSSKDQSNKMSSNSANTNSKNIQDSILRHMSREMTPTISEVYHERNIGLGLAPPLSKLLLSKNYDDCSDDQLMSVPPVGSLGKNISLADAINDIDLNATTSSKLDLSPKAACHICSNNASDILCGCSTVSTSKLKTKLTSNVNSNKNTTTTSSSSTSSSNSSILKPWLSNVTPNIVKASDLTTADILEQQNKLKSGVLTTLSNSSSTENSLLTIKRGLSPFTERRDEGDGRSVADSQCSGSFRTADLTASNVAAAQQKLQQQQLQQQQQSQPHRNKYVVLDS